MGCRQQGERLHKWPEEPTAGWQSYQVRIYHAILFCFCMWLLLEWFWLPTSFCESTLLSAALLCGLCSIMLDLDEAVAKDWFGS